MPLTLSPVRGGHIVSPSVVLYYLKIEGHIFFAWQIVAIGPFKVYIRALQFEIFIHKFE